MSELTAGQSRIQGEYRDAAAASVLGHEAIERAKTRVSDAQVAKALEAYEDMPAGTGRQERMRQALYTVLRSR